MCSDEGDDDDGVQSYINDGVSGQLRHRLDPLHTHRQLIPVHVNHTLTYTHTHTHTHTHIHIHVCFCDCGDFP